MKSQLKHEVHTRCLGTNHLCSTLLATPPIPLPICLGRPLIHSHSILLADRAGGAQVTLVEVGVQ